MKITRQLAARKLQAYLNGRLDTDGLVAWAEQAMIQGDFAPADAAVLRKVVPRLGVADVRAFGLEWSDCARMLRQLGFRARINVVAA
jgi:cobyrinic acid a,c-diamide synthase